MATVVFTVIGTAIGGPLGGLIGSVVGQQVDKAVLGSGPKREGPRIKELAVQTSSYGTQIPAVFGTMRVSGSVIWSTDLIEKRTSRSGGKNGPGTVNYSYSVNMAVALSSRPILRVGRIWAEGNLLRGAAGDFKVQTGFRFHAGYDDQAPDPLIASAEGSNNCPAYRGISYAVFENLQLADFGNRIPSMTFELFERDGSVLLADIFAAASDGLITGAPPDAVMGYTLQGDSVRTGLSPLIEAFSAQIRPRFDTLQLYRPQKTEAYTGDIDPIVVDQNQRAKPQTDTRSASFRQSRAIALRYYDPQRDYQAGLQRSGWSVAGIVDEQIDLPAVVDTAAAQQIARNMALQRNARRDQRQLSIAIGRDRAEIGQAIGNPAMRIAEIEHFSGYATIKAERWPSINSILSTQIEPGRHLPFPDVTSGTTMLQIVELPSLGSIPATEPIVAIAAGGTGAGWRKAAVLRNIDNATTDLGAVTLPSAIGTLRAPVSAYSPRLIDDRNILHVRIDSNSEPPDNVTGTPLSANAPAVMIGNELIRFGAIEPIGENEFRISNLLRDVAHTGIGDHDVGERAVFIDRDRLLFPDWSRIAPGTVLDVEALGLGDEIAARQSLVVAGLATRPLAPVHGKIEKAVDGGLIITWIWRSRHDPGWLDGVDLPSAEGSQRFELAIRSSDTIFFQTEVSSDAFRLAATQIASWGLPMGTAITVSIRQIGTYGLSDPLDISVLVQDI
ncbi:MAG: phage tail protein [Sphingorhabdus sp.]